MKNIITCFVVFCCFAKLHCQSVNITEDGLSKDEDVQFNVTEANATDVISSRFISGTALTATTITEVPYVMHISSTTTSGTRLCSGALITSQYIVTAASCVHDASVTTVTAGTIDITGTTQTGTGTTIVHPKYYIHPEEYDIALIKLDTPFTISSTVATIRIAPKTFSDDSKDLAEKTVRLVSFGNILSSATVLLSYTLMSVMPRSTCIREMRTRSIKIGLHQDCLSTNNGARGGCNPLDKGAPVTYKLNTDTEYSLVGILTYFDTSCASTTPNVFTRIGPVWDFLRKYVPIYTNIG